MFIIVASCVIDLGLEVEAFREMMGNSSIGCRVNAWALVSRGFFKLGEVGVLSYLKLHFV